MLLVGRITPSLRTTRFGKGSSRFGGRGWATFGSGAGVVCAATGGGATGSEGRNISGEGVGVVTTLAGGAVFAGDGVVAATEDSGCGFSSGVAVSGDVTAGMAGAGVETAGGAGTGCVSTFCGCGTAATVVGGVVAGGGAFVSPSNLTSVRSMKA